VGKVSCSENEPYLFKIKSTQGGYGTRDLALTRQRQANYADHGKAKLRECNSNPASGSLNED
jgi:hypothetical protein